MLRKALTSSALRSRKAPAALDNLLGVEAPDKGCTCRYRSQACRINMDHMDRTTMLRKALTSSALRSRKAPAALDNLLGVEAPDKG